MVQAGGRVCLVQAGVEIGGPPLTLPTSEYLSPFESVEAGVLCRWYLAFYVTVCVFAFFAAWRQMKKLQDPGINVLGISFRIHGRTGPDTKQKGEIQRWANPPGRIFIETKIPPGLKYCVQKRRNIPVRIGPNHKLAVVPPENQPTNQNGYKKCVNRDSNAVVSRTKRQILVQQQSCGALIDFLPKLSCLVR